VFDMLPPGVGRTDGTGDQGHIVLPPGFSGGTTPLCALPPFGKLIGAPVPAVPLVPRVLIDYLGKNPLPGNADGAILISRPTAPGSAGPGSFVLGAMQFGFPNSPVPPLMLGNGVEMYTTNNPYIYVAGLGYPNQVHLELLAPLPAVGLPMTVQMFFSVLSTVQGGVGPAPCPGTSDLTATPALWIPL
jgi:hypothetical protein